MKILFSEFLGAFIIYMVYYVTVVIKRKSPYVTGAVMGATIGGLTPPLQWISGAGFNICRTLGPVIFSGLLFKNVKDFFAEGGIIYFFMPFIAMSLSALFCKYALVQLLKTSGRNN